MSATTTNERPLENLTVAELKEQAGDLGVSYSGVEPIDAGGNTPGKADWIRAVRLAEATAGKRMDPPSAQQIIRTGLVAGPSDEEIREAVLEVHPDSKIEPGWVAWTIRNGRRNETEWCEAHKERLKELRPGI